MKCVDLMWLQLLIGHQIFEWYMARLLAGTGHPKNMCYDEIELCALYLDTIMGSILSLIGGLFQPTILSVKCASLSFKVGPDHNPIITFMCKCPLWNTLICAIRLPSQTLCLFTHTRYLGSKSIHKNLNHCLFICTTTKFFLKKKHIYNLF